MMTMPYPYVARLPARPSSEVCTEPCYRATQTPRPSTVAACTCRTQSMRGDTRARVRGAPSPSAGWTGSISHILHRTL
ncbi:hypothetical protein DPMN_153016 [Dreissena polymorpha]|uniref:Uncharacterized protein n=1 Tax=Dreissena polymorpha TaxID=45954 RepID=A0A9D4FLH0_DREPO|nr:hypothetical protein DPMN_153016 [Dreissena polymorpha]